jgi:hypothetical protein
MIELELSITLSRDPGMKSHSRADGACVLANAAG